MKGCAVLLGTGFGLALLVQAAAWAQAPLPAPPAVQPASAVVFAPMVPVPETAVVSRVVQAPWFDQPLGPDPAAWRFSAALDAAGAYGQADALRRVLLSRHLAQGLAEPTEPAITVRQAIEAGANLRPPDADFELRARWIELMSRHLKVVLPTAAVPVPPELEADAPRMRELGPGLWSLHAGDGTLRGRVWWLLLHNLSTQPLALADFRVRAPAGALGTTFDCSLPRYAETTLALPGRDTAYLCRANASVAESAPAWADLVRLLRSAAALPVQIEPLDLSAATPVQRVFARLEQSQQAAAQALAAQLQTAGGPPAAGRPGVTRSAAGAASADVVALRGGIGRWTFGVLVLAALGVYALMNSLGGRRVAMLSCSGLLMALAVAAAFKGLSAGWSPLPQVDLRDPRGVMLPVVLAVSAPILATLVLALCHELLFGERIGLLRHLGRALADGMIR